MKRRKYAKLLDLLDENLISLSELARAADINEKTARNLRNGKHELRTQTKRRILEGLNRLLSRLGKRTVGSTIFN